MRAKSPRFPMPGFLALEVPRIVNIFIVPNTDCASFGCHRLNGEPSMIRARRFLGYRLACGDLPIPSLGETTRSFNYSIQTPILGKTGGGLFNGVFGVRVALKSCSQQAGSIRSSQRSGIAVALRLRRCRGRGCWIGLRGCLSERACEQRLCLSDLHR